MRRATRRLRDRLWEMRRGGRDPRAAATAAVQVELLERRALLSATPADSGAGGGDGGPYRPLPDLPDLVSDDYLGDFAAFPGGADAGPPVTLSDSGDGVTHVVSDADGTRAYESEWELDYAMAHDAVAGTFGESLDFSYTVVETFAAAAGTLTTTHTGHLTWNFQWAGADGAADDRSWSLTTDGFARSESTGTLSFDPLAPPPPDQPPPDGEPDGGTGGTGELPPSSPFADGFPATVPGGSTGGTTGGSTGTTTAGSSGAGTFEVLEASAGTNFRHTEGGAVRHTADGTLTTLSWFGSGGGGSSLSTRTTWTYSTPGTPPGGTTGGVDPRVDNPWVLPEPGDRTTSTGGGVIAASAGTGAGWTSIGSLLIEEPDGGDGPLVTGTWDLTADASAHGGGRADVWARSRTDRIDDYGYGSERVAWSSTRLAAVLPSANASVEAYHRGTLDRNVGTVDSGYRARADAEGVTWEGRHVALTGAHAAESSADPAAAGDDPFGGEFPADGAAFFGGGSGADLFRPPAGLAAAAFDPADAPDFTAGGISPDVYQSGYVPDAAGVPAAVDTDALAPPTPPAAGADPLAGPADAGVAAGPATPAAVAAPDPLSFPALSGSSHAAAAVPQNRGGGSGEPWVSEPPGTPTGDGGAAGSRLRFAAGGTDEWHLDARADSVLTLRADGSAEVNTTGGHTLELDSTGWAQGTVERRGEPGGGRLHGWNPRAHAGTLRSDTVYHAGAAGGFTARLWADAPAADGTVTGGYTAAGHDGAGLSITHDAVETAGTTSGDLVSGRGDFFSRASARTVTDFDLSAGETAEFDDRLTFTLPATGGGAGEGGGEVTPVFAGTL